MNASVERAGTALRVAWLQHVPFEGLGSMQPWLAARGHEVTRVRTYAGDPLPDLDAFDWLIVMGGPMNVDQYDRHPWLATETRFIGAALRAEKRVLGICLGAQLMARALGAGVRPGQKEIGWFDIAMQPDAREPFFRGFPDRIEVFHWHGDALDLPAGARRAASSPACPNQAFVYGERAVGLQFHMETTPAAARALVEQFPEDLAPGRYVQAAADMLGQPARFQRLNAWMARLLARMEAAQALHTGA